MLLFLIRGKWYCLLVHNGPGYVNTSTMPATVIKAESKLTARRMPTAAISSVLLAGAVSLPWEHSSPGEGRYYLNMEQILCNYTDYFYNAIKQIASRAAIREGWAGNY